MLRKVKTRNQIVQLPLGQKVFHSFNIEIIVEKFFVYRIMQRIAYFKNIFTTRNINLMFQFRSYSFYEMHFYGALRIKPTQSNSQARVSHGVGILFCTRIKNAELQ